MRNSSLFSLAFLGAPAVLGSEMGAGSRSRPLASNVLGFYEIVWGDLPSEGMSI